MKDRSELTVLILVFLFSLTKSELRRITIYSVR